MTLATVVAALNRSINGDDQIDLYQAASVEAPLKPLLPVLGRFSIDSPFVLSQAQVAVGPSSAALTATGRWGLSEAESQNWVTVAARLDCDAPSSSSEDVTLTLTLTISQPEWNFGTTFPTLPTTPWAGENGMSMAKSFLGSVQVNSVRLSGSTLVGESGLGFAGLLPQTDFWRALPNWRWLSGLVSSWPLNVSGTVTLPSTPAEFPTIDLLAEDASATLDLGSGLPSLAALGFGLICRPDLTTSNFEYPAVSYLTFSGRLCVGGLVARVGYQVLASERSLGFTVAMGGDGADLVGGMSQLGQIFGLPTLPTPTNFLTIVGFRFSAIQFYLSPTLDPPGFTVDYVLVAIDSTRSWTSPLPFITLDGVGISWQLGSAGASSWMAANIQGAIAIATTPPVRIDASLTIPQWAASATMRSGDYIAITDLFTAYFKGDAPDVPEGMNVTELSIEANPRDQSYSANAKIVFGQPVDLPDPPEPPFDPSKIYAKFGWTIHLGVTDVTLLNLSFQVSMVGGNLAGGIGGQFYFGEVTQNGLPPFFNLQAEYPGPAEVNPTGWTFSGELNPGDSIDLTALLGRFIGAKGGATWGLELLVDRLYFTFSTGSEAYAFGGSVSAAWAPALFGTQLKIAAAASLDIVKPGTSQSATGTLAARFSINRIEVSGAASLGSPQPTFEFQVQFDEIWLRAVTSWRTTGEEAPAHQVITLQLGGVTVGGILEYLVDLAAPTIGYTLPSPWNILNSVELSRFTLTLDPTENLVEFVYAANADLVFMRLDTIGVRYRRGEDGGVSLILTGDFLGQRYDGDDLSWDVVNESPPELPGAADEFIDLRYLGLGQRVALTRLPDTVAQTLALLKDELKPVSGAGANPLSDQGVQWSPSSQMLLGVDVGLLGLIDFGFVFNDPFLYGLSIGLGGEDAGVLAGLKFEILYKKISNSVGMFRIELTLPEAFRSFEFGEVSVTLGVLVVEIYTNGNFKIDLGFPYDRDFERSFTVEAFPYIGRGGFYFGLLDGVTSSRTPRITNGNFAPVIELGVGLAIGVGKDIHEGPVSGGLYVEVEVIFEGVIGWFHSTTAGAPTSVYYRAEAVAAIHGKLFGQIDFKVVKVSLTVEAYAAAMVTLEAHQPTLFALEVKVDAEAEVKIGFVNLSFSYGIDLDASFQLGTASATPWILSSDQSTETLPTIGDGRVAGAGQSRRVSVRGRSRQRLARPRRRPSRRIAALQSAHRQTLGLVSDATMNWQPSLPVFSDAPRLAPMLMLPQFSVSEVPLSWSATPPANAAPQYRFALQLFAGSGVAPDTLTAAAARKRSAALAAQATDDGDLEALAADTLVRGLLLYCIQAIPGGPWATSDTITAGRLALAAALLDDPDAAAAGFNPTALGTFFQTNINFAISGVPMRSNPPAPLGAMAVAMPPYLSWTSDQTGPVDFASDNSVGALYLWGAAAQARRFSPHSQSPSAPPDDPTAQYFSYAGHVFSDWCLIIARSALREARASLEMRPLPPAGADDTLAELAASLPIATVPYQVRPGDTIETIAEALGATLDEILFLNADIATTLASTTVGASLSIVLGISPEGLAIDNPECALFGSALDLGDIAVPVAAGDTLDGLASRFGVEPAAILAVPGQDFDARLLTEGAAFDAPAATWTTPPNPMNVLRAAAIFFVRYAGLTSAQADGDRDVAGWYAQAVADINQDVLSAATVDPHSGELPAGLELSIPVAFDDRTPGGTYVTVPGDTLARIGMTLDLEQTQATTTGTQGWPLFRDGVVAVEGGYSLPAWSGPRIATAETLAMLARRTIVNWRVGAEPAADWAGLAGWIGGAQVLAPLALITIPSVTATPNGSTTFARLSAASGLSLGELGHRLANVAGLVAGETLIARHLPADVIESLVARVVAEATAGIAAEASRALFSGQQVPEPVDGGDGHVVASTTNSKPLFDETGQQWTLAVDSSDPGGTAVSLSLVSNVAWITLHESTIVGAGEDLAQLRARAPAAFAAPANRGIARGREVGAGMVVQTDPVSALNFTVTNAEVMATAPATGLAWPPHTPPEPLRLRGEARVTYGLAQHVTLQTPVALPVPGFTLGQNTLSLHPFPPALRARARARTATKYAVYVGEPESADAVPVASGTFAAMIEFKVRRLAATGASYHFAGVGVEQLPLLLDLVGYLQAEPAAAVGYLATSPSTTAPDRFGLQVIEGGGWLLKTNLSSESAPPSSNVERAARVPVDPTRVRADLGDLGGFVRLLWEGSVIGGEGFLFGMDGGIADGAFDAGDQTSVRLIVMSAARDEIEATEDAPAAHALLPFDTAFVVVDQGLSEGLLFAEAEGDDDPSEFTAQALVPAGNAGFTLTLPRPILPSIPPDDGQLALRQSYSLLLADTSASPSGPFTIPSSAPTVPPRPFDGDTQPPWARERARRIARGAGRRSKGDPPPAPYWAYETVLPVYRFGPASVAPVVIGLPDPLEDPYRGVGTASSAPALDLTLRFGDLLGNRSSTSGSPLVVPLGYTDPLIGPSSWPATSIGFRVSGTAGAPVVSVTLAAKAQALMPTVNQRGDALVSQAERQRQMFQTIYFQWAQPGLTAAVKTTLDISGSLPAAGAPDGLMGFAAGAYVAADVATGFQAVYPPAGPLDSVVAEYGIGWEALAAVNAETLLVDIFGSDVALAVPAFAVFAAGDSANSIAAAAALEPGWPRPSASAILGATQNLDDLPLRAGAILSYPPRAVTLSTDAPTLASAAAALSTTSGWLAEDCAADPILAGGFRFRVEGVDVVVGLTPLSEGDPPLVRTLLDASQAFANRGVRILPGQLGAAHADADDLLLPGASGHCGHYLADGGQTLGDNSSGASSDDLIAANLALANIYDAGALVYLGDFGVITPRGDDRLAAFSARYGCPPAALLGANRATSLPTGTRLAVPGAVMSPAPEKARAPYTIRAGDILSGIAAGFDFASSPDAATALAERNAALPGTVAQGQTFDVLVGSVSVSVETDGLQSFAAVLASVQVTASEATMADVAAAFGVAGRLRAGGVLICPAVILPAATAPEAIPEAYGVSVAAFALANAGIVGLLSSGQTVIAPNPDLEPEQTLALDTLNSIVGRFNAQAVAKGFTANIDVAGVLLANQGEAILSAGTRALLPPAEFVLTVEPSATGPTPGAAFPLAVELTVARPPALVHPAFVATSVATARATIASAASRADGGSMTFDTFRQDFQTAFPNMRLATAKIEGETSDVWVADFGAAGVTSVAVACPVSFAGAQQARMLSLAPLYGRLVSRAGVSIEPLDAEGKLDPANALSMQFQSIDVEVWSARFLSDFDALLAPATAGALNDATLRGEFVRLMQVKAALQAAIPGALTPVFAVSGDGPTSGRSVTDPNLAAGLEEAKRLLGQWLGLSLSTAASAAAILQYDAAVDSAWTRSTQSSGDAALYGEARASEAPAPSIEDQANPSWRLQAGKISLSDPAPFLTLPLSVSDPGRQAFVSLDLSFSVANLEINSRPVAEAPGYNRSDWLTMTPPLSGGGMPAALDIVLGPATVPIPLRSFPALPLILVQQGLADLTLPVTLATAPAWAFQLVYSHEHAAQDQVLVTVEFNLAPTPTLAARTQADADLFTALAQYVNVADKLNGLLAALGDPAGGAPSLVTRNAVATFADLADRISGLWTTRLPESTAASPSEPEWIPAQASVFAAAITYESSSSRKLATYTLTLQPAAIGAVIAWPDVACLTPDGVWIALIGQEPAGDSRAYAPPAGVELPLDAWPRLQLTWPGLNCGATQNARARLQVLRNWDLLGSEGPATNPRFLHRTSTVTAAAIVTPSIARVEPIALAGASVETALSDAFESLFPAANRPDGLRLAIGLSYGFALAGAGEDVLLSELAVALMPDQILTGATPGAIANVLDAWMASVAPNPAGGRWILSLSQSSTIDPGKPVLMSLGRLVYAIAQSTSSDGQGET